MVRRPIGQNGERDLFSRAGAGCGRKTLNVRAHPTLWELSGKPLAKKGNRQAKAVDEYETAKTGQEDRYEGGPHRPEAE